MSFLYFCITLAVAWAVGWCFYRLHLPAGALMGAMLAVAAFNLLTDQGVFYSQLKPLLQVAAGAMIGGKIGRSEALALRKTIKPVTLLILGMLVLNLTFGASIHLWGELDVTTSLFATTPGGVADMALIASDFGADVGVVAIMQLFRCVITFSVFPPIFKLLIGRMPPEQKFCGDVELAKIPFRWQTFTGLLLCATIVGSLFAWLGVAAGPLIGGMVGGAIFAMTRQRVLFPKPLQFAMQVASGAFIGIQLDRQNVAQLPKLMVPILVMLVGIVFFTFAIAFILRKLTHLPLDVCLLSSTPAGVQEMVLLSEDLGSDTVTISLLQTGRLMFVILFFPFMIEFVTQWLIR